MNKRQLVLDALQKKETPVLPYHLDLSELTRERLIKYFADPDFEKKVGNAIATARNESFVELPGNREKDMFGVVWSKVQEGDFGTVEKYLLADGALGNYQFPTPDEALIRQKCETLIAENQDLFKIYIIGFSLFERAWTLRNMENLLMDFILDPSFVYTLLDKIEAYNFAVLDIVLEYKEIDCILFGDDWGQQRGLIMGPKHWRTFIKPYLKRLYSKVKSNGFYVGQHSCGDVSEIFPDLIELGLDIYNTFQPEIYDVAWMKKEYGKDITFYGGISTQELLPYATPDKVKREMRRLMKLLGKGGGYIVAPTHAMPNDIPIENILAFLEVVQNQ